VEGCGLLTILRDVFGDGLWGGGEPTLLIQDNPLVIATEETIPLIIILCSLSNFDSSLCLEECVVVDELLDLTRGDQGGTSGSPHLIEPIKRDRKEMGTIDLSSSLSTRRR
jgi:hypothetical protein